MIERFELKKDSLVGDSEMIHLAMDLIACPFVDKSVKGNTLLLRGSSE